MYRVSCHTCNKDFCRRDVMLRHQRNVHSNQNETQDFIPKETKQVPWKETTSFSKPGDGFFFKHPFTCIVSGPTSCGKTHFVKILLQQMKISPLPERIMYLYKRWQPLYDDIMTTVYPPVEFIRGVPTELDQDSFIDPSQRNLIILDDLMHSMSKDVRINDLFTEGSHHRNLSVLAINQNLYYGKDPTQRRNCHYMILFNNPIDRQQIHTLARQMYPGKSHYMMRCFEKSTSKPYGYLLLDLKPTTPETERMRTDIFPIKEQQPEKLTELESDSDSERTDSIDRNEEEYFSPPDKMYTCDECGWSCSDIHMLQSHVKNWCSERPFKKRRLNETFEDREEEVFNTLMEKASAANEDEWNEKYQKYIDQGLNDEQAELKANKKLKENDLSKFKSFYKTLVSHIVRLENGNIHQRVMKYTRDFLDEGYGLKVAIKMAISKNRHLLEELFEEEDDSEESEQEEEPEEATSEEEMESDDDSEIQDDDGVSRNSNRAAIVTI